MMTERQLQETIARCVSIAVYYHGSERTGWESDRMTSEVRATALSLGEMGLTATEARVQVVGQVERELIERFGPIAGAKLARTFAEAFAGEDPDAAPSPNGRWRSPARSSKRFIV